MFNIKTYHTTFWSCSISRRITLHFDHVQYQDVSHYILTMFNIKTYHTTFWSCSISRRITLHFDHVPYPDVSHYISTMFNIKTYHTTFWPCSISRRITCFILDIVHVFRSVCVLQKVSQSIVLTVNTYENNSYRATENKSCFLLLVRYCGDKYPYISPQTLKVHTTHTIRFISP